MHIPRQLLNLLGMFRFPGSAGYWEWRYASGGNSGAGSYGAEARYKQEFLNSCLARHHIQTVIDFGCGDGNQLRGLEVVQYRGYDVSTTVVERCRALYAGDPGKSFHFLGDYRGETAEAAFSLDVLYHLVEDGVFDDYLSRLFAAATRLVVIYAVDQDEMRTLRGRHVRFRKFTTSIAARFPKFRLVEAPPRPGHLPGNQKAAASFFVYERNP